MYNGTSTDKTLNQTFTLLPDFGFHRITRGFHRAFAKNVTCRQGRLLLRKTYSPPAVTFTNSYIKTNKTAF